MTTKPLSLEHLIRPSSLTGKAPLILMLHGYGSDENDLFSFASELPEKYLIISAKAPYALQTFGNAWYEINFDATNTKFSNIEQAVASRQKIECFIDEVIESYPVDSEQITLLGFSQGAILSYATALSNPQKIKQVVALSGYIDQAMLVDGFRENNFDSLRFYCSHGTVDQVIPVAWAQKTAPFLDKLQIDNTYAEFPVGHGVCPQNFFEFKKWLEEA